MRLPPEEPFSLLLIDLLQSYDDLILKRNISDFVEVSTIKSNYIFYRGTS